MAWLIHVVLTRFINYADEIVRLRIGVIHHGVQFSDLKGRAEAGISDAYGKSCVFFDQTA